MNPFAKLTILGTSKQVGSRRIVRFLTTLTVMLCSLVWTVSSSAAESRKVAVELIFEYTPSWEDETRIYLVRLPEGAIYCSVQTRPESREDQPNPKWKNVKEVSISAEDFARLETGFDTPDLKSAAERDWPPLPDGSGWILRKKIGSWSVEIRAVSPDMSTDGIPIVKLARAFTEVAGIAVLPKQLPDLSDGIPAVVPIEPFPKVAPKQTTNP